MSINNVEIQDSSGNVYYPHTDASIVKFGETTVGASLSDIENNVANINASNIATNLNSCGVVGQRIVHRITVDTLNTPYKAGMTTSTLGLAETNLSDTGFGSQIIYPSGSNVVFTRTLSSGTWSAFQKLTNDSDSTRTTTAKDVTGAINELNANKAKQTDLTNHLADLITDSDGAHGLKVESGNWTPIIAPGSHSYSGQLGKYFKIGNVVKADFSIAVSVKDTGATGTLHIAGLPFMSNIGMSGTLGSMSLYTNLTFPFSNSKEIFPVVNISSNSIELNVGSDNAAQVSLSISQMGSNFMLAGSVYYNI